MFGAVKICIHATWMVFSKLTQYQSTALTNYLNKALQAMKDLTHILLVLIAQDAILTVNGSIGTKIHNGANYAYAHV